MVKPLSATTMNNLKPTEFEYKCKYKTNQHPDGCQDTETAFLYMGNDKPLQRCQCFWERIKTKRLEYFYSILPKKYDIRNHEIREDQLTIIDSLLPEKVNGMYDEIEKGCWLYGKSGFGKTHLIYFMLEKLIKHSTGEPITFIIVKSKQLFDLWSDKYGDSRSESKQKLYEIFSKDIIIIEEIDKVGQMTQAREAEVFDMLNESSEKKKIIYVTAQISIKEYCRMFPSEIRHQEIESGKGPRENRLVELCDEIKA